jgi:hypothetical protein
MGYARTKFPFFTHSRLRYSVHIQRSGGIAQPYLRKTPIFGDTSEKVAGGSHYRFVTDLEHSELRATLIIASAASRWSS